MGEEAYELLIADGEIVITAGGEAGAFYAQQSLAQLRRAYGRALPSVKITDYPRFEYRGVHLDVSRHFHDIDFVKKQLRMFASLKINRFHFHLVDGAGWRIQIEKYPLLTEIAAWRPEAYYYDWTDGGKRFCREDYPGAYGGYYTKEELRELVEYADSLHITIVPEIEMFGHSEEVTAVYAQLACGDSECLIGEDGTYSCGSAVYCIGKEETFEFLENVLDEVMEIFPSEYIHIGGDEAEKEHWKNCPYCQARIRKEGLKDEDELQSYGIKRIEEFVNSRGRQILGWDEILEGGLAPNAAVMSWRGVSGGEAAAAAGHKVVMTPGEFCYLDKCQGDPSTEPAGFGGNLNLKKVYSYDPAPLEMPGREFIMGVQTNLWSELIQTDEHAEHMYYPRVYALSEIAWTPHERISYKGFRERVLEFNKWAVADGYHPYDLGSGLENREGYGEVHEHLAMGCAVEYGTSYWPSYAASGDGALTDGLTGGWDYREAWQGFLNKDAIATVDLGEVCTFSSISTSFLQWRNVEIMLPACVSYEISDDGENYTELASIPYELDWSESRPVFQDYSWSGSASARYIRMTGHINEGRWGWLFTDEIIIR